MWLSVTDYLDLLPDQQRLSLVLLRHQIDRPWLDLPEIRYRLYETMVDASLAMLGTSRNRLPHYDFRADFERCVPPRIAAIRAL